MLVSMTSVAVLLILLTETIPSVQPTTFRTRSAPDNLPGCVSVFEESRITPCYCDPACKFYGDCCHEYRHTAKRLFQCVDLSSLSVSNGGFAFVFNRCPPGTNEERKQLCERPVRPSDGPDRSIVIASDDMRLFRNVHCALCHEAIYKEPISKLRCSTQLSFDQFRNESDQIFLQELGNIPLSAHSCEIKTDLPFNQYRRCDDTRLIATHCPDNWVKNSSVALSSSSFSSLTANLTTEDIKNRCAEAPTRYTRCEKDDRTFRNPFCQTCLRENCVPFEKKASLGHGRKSFPPYYSYSIITDFKRFSDMEYSVAQNDTVANNTTEVSENMLRDVLSILTMLFCVLSAMSLVLLIIVFVTVPSLRNFGGVLTLALASTLLVGLLCFLIGPIIEQFPILCRIVGVVMYFAYLSSFAWMSLFAADVLRTFASSARASGAVRSSSIGRRFAKFSVGGWLLPLVVTLAAVTVDVVWPQSAVSARFGRGQCYFNNGYALLGWFYVPVSVAVVANVAMSVAVIVAVWRTTQQTKSIRRSNDSGKWMIRLCVKITSIFGAIWLLGLAAALVKNVFFTEIAGLINSLQGVLVSLSFLLNSRTIRETRSLRSDSASIKRAASSVEKGTSKTFLKEK